MKIGEISTASENKSAKRDNETPIEETGLERLRLRPRRIVKQSDVEEIDQPEKVDSESGPALKTDEKQKLIKENLYLLAEIDKLKHSNSTLFQRLYYLESLRKT